MGNKMAPRKKVEEASEQVLYVRNARPNMVIFKFNDVRYVLQHRGNRADSVPLPEEARKDNLISRWLKNGQLEEISKEAFMQLGKRSVDVLPNEFLKRDVRNNRAADLKLVTDKDDASGLKVNIVPGDATKTVNKISRPEWAGELMTTEEELELFSYEDQGNANYQSKHR